MIKTGFPSVDKTHLQGIPEAKLHPQIPAASLLAAFSQINAGQMNKPMVEVDGMVYTKQEALQSSVMFARALLGMKITAGDTIAIATTNCYEGIVATFAANAIGVKVAMFEPSTCDNPERFREEVEAHAPKLILVENKSKRWIAKQLTTFRQIKFIVVVNATDEEVVRKYDMTQILEFASYTTTEAAMAEIEKHSMTGVDEPMIYLKTSGSSAGVPKTLPFSNRAVCAALVFASNSTGIQTNDHYVGRVLVSAPFQHGYGWMVMFMNLIGGNTVVLVGATAEDIAKYHELNPGQIYATPQALRQFINLTPPEADLSSLTAFYCAGDVTPEDEYQTGMAFFAAHGAKAEIRTNYGISEGMCIGTTTDGVPHRAGTVGKFYLGPEWLIVDEKLQEVKYGEEGEVIVSSPTLCQGYFNNPEATEKAFFMREDKIWFKTGDFASLSEDGYVTFAGRKNRFIFVDGVTDKINLTTVEQALMALPTVEEAAVVAERDAEGVDFLKAFITPSDGAVKTPAFFTGIRQGLAKALQPYQIPREIIALEEIPMMESGKVDYKKLKNM